MSIPIIIHLMSRFKRKPEAWGAMRFLIEAYRKQRKRLQIEKLLLLLVRCMVVLLAGLALAGPVLSGCSRDSLALSGGAGRVVYIVIDDALSSQTREAGTTRLQQHKDEALRVIQEMTAGDRAVILRMARPTERVIDQPTADASALKDAVESIQPRYSRGELINCLLLIDQSMREEGVRDGDAVVVLLSDFPVSSDYFQEQLPPELEGFGKRASIVTAMPPKGTDNVQVMSLTPRRSVVVAEPTGATMIGGRAELLRYGAIDQPREAELEIVVTTAGGQTLAESSRRITWPIGERQRGINFDLPVQLPADTLFGVGQDLVLRARLRPNAQDAGLDVLSADDQAVCVVRLRDRLQVALIDGGEDVNPDPAGFEPGQWLRAALTPGGPSEAGPFELSPLMPNALKPETLTPFDAVIVLRPDELTARSWSSLAEFTKQGGLLWVFTPAVASEPKWARSMKLAFALPWVFGDQLSSVSTQGQATSKPVPVDASTPAPDALQFLAADWREKLGWVSVNTWLALSTPEEDQWIVLDHEQSEALQDESVLMAKRSVGQGSLLFVATALDTRFTNLPIRALFVPLMHDTLRGVLGDSFGQLKVVAGDQPTLGKRWVGAGELQLLDANETLGEDTAGQTLLVNSEDGKAQLRQPVQTPGVYKDRRGTAPLLAVNVDSAAGDTIGGQRELELLLDQLGGWVYLKDQRDAGGVLAQTIQGNNLTGLLLWALLALVLLETALARWFSHATEHDKPTVVGRVLGALHGNQLDQKPMRAGGRS